MDDDTPGSGIHATDRPDPPADPTPVAYRSPDEREAAADEALLRTYVGPVDGPGVDDDLIATHVRESPTGGSRDRFGNLIHDPGVVPGRGRYVPGRRDEDGNLIHSPGSPPKPKAPEPVVIEEEEPVEDEPEDDGKGWPEGSEEWSAAQWREFAAEKEVVVGPADSRAKVRKSLREAGVIR